MHKKKIPMMRRTDICAIGAFFTFVGLVLVATGVLMGFYYETETKHLVEKRTRLTENSDGLNAWKRSGDGRKETFHVFHVTNPEEVVQYGRSIKVEEKGPFVYRVIEKKTNIVLDEMRSILSYHLTKSYSFDSVASGGRSEDDIVTVINLPILSLVSKLRHSPNKEAAVDELAKAKENLFTKVSVADLLWGHKNTQLHRINERLNVFQDTTIGILHQTGVPSHTRDMGHYTVATGTDELRSVWNIKQWNNKTNLRNWSSMKSSTIKGTNGYAWHPFLTSSDKLEVFDPDWCLSLSMSHEGQSSVETLSAGRYTISSSVLDSTKSENKEFFEKTPNGDGFLASGVLNVTSCNTERIPWILSQPSFYQADPSFAKAIHNLPAANKERHETSLDIDMLTGKVIASRYRKQFNVLVKNDSEIFKATRNFRTPVLIPVAWVEEEYSMADSEKLRVQELVFRRDWNERNRNGVIGFGLFLLLFVIPIVIVDIVKLSNSQSRQEWEPIPPF